MSGHSIIGEGPNQSPSARLLHPLGSGEDISKITDLSEEVMQQTCRRWLAEERVGLGEPQGEGGLTYRDVIDGTRGRSVRIDADRRAAFTQTDEWPIRVYTFLGAPTNLEITCVVRQWVESKPDKKLAKLILSYLVWPEVKRQLVDAAGPLLPLIQGGLNEFVKDQITDISRIKDISRMDDKTAHVVITVRRFLTSFRHTLLSFGLPATPGTQAWAWTELLRDAGQKVPMQADEWPTWGVLITSLMMRPYDDRDSVSLYLMRHMRSELEAQSQTDRLTADAERLSVISQRIECEEERLAFRHGEVLPIFSGASWVRDWRKVGRVCEQHRKWWRDVGRYKVAEIDERRVNTFSDFDPAAASKPAKLRFNTEARRKAEELVHDGKDTDDDAIEQAVRALKPYEIKRLQEEWKFQDVRGSKDNLTWQQEEQLRKNFRQRLRDECKRQKTK